MLNITNIVAPRVPLVDVKTGLITREWYMYFFNLFNQTGQSVNSLDDLQKLPVAMDIAFLTEANKVIEGIESADNSSALVSEITNLKAELQALQSQIAAFDAEQQKQIQAIEYSPIITPQLHRKAYGSFYDVTDQTAAAINTAYAMTFGNTQYSLGVTLGSPTSQVYVDRPGIYNIQFSAQLDKTSASLGNVWIWLDKNGTTVADTATQVSLQGSSAATVAAWNFLLELNAGDYFRLMWSTDDTACFIKHDAAVAPVPVIPSIILTVTNNINDNTPY